MCSPEENTMKILIENGILADPAGGILERRNLLIDGGSIAAIGT